MGGNMLVFTGLENLLHKKVEVIGEKSQGSIVAAWIDPPGNVATGGIGYVERKSRGLMVLIQTDGGYFKEISIELCKMLNSSKV